MKQFILIPLLTLAFEASSMAGWFFSDDQQAQFRQERANNNILTGLVCILGVGSVGAMVAGTMIGSKTRRASDRNEK